MEILTPVPASPPCASHLVNERHEHLDSALPSLPAHPSPSIDDAWMSCLRRNSQVTHLFREHRQCRGRAAVARVSVRCISIECLLVLSHRSSFLRGVPFRFPLNVAFRGFNPPRHFDLRFWFEATPPSGIGRGRQGTTILLRHSVTWRALLWLVIL